MIHSETTSRTLFNSLDMVVWCMVILMVLIAKLISGWLQETTFRLPNRSL